MNGHTGKKKKVFPNPLAKNPMQIKATLHKFDYEFMIGFIKKQELFNTTDFTRTAIRKLRELCEKKRPGSVEEYRKIGAKVIEQEKKRRKSPPKALSIKKKEDELTWNNEDLENE